MISVNNRIRFPLHLFRIMVIHFAGEINCQTVLLNLIFHHTPPHET